MYPTTATVAFGNNVCAPCPSCGTAVIVRISNPAAEVGLMKGGKHLESGGSGKCRGCGRILSASQIKIPHYCWQPSQRPETKAAVDRKKYISKAHGGSK